jgi:hypothetical protein
MKLKALPKRTRARLYELSTHHRLDVDQVITIAIDVLWTALEGHVIPMPRPDKKLKPARGLGITTVGSVLEKQIQETLDRA